MDSLVDTGLNYFGKKVLVSFFKVLNNPKYLGL